MEKRKVITSIVVLLAGLQLARAATVLLLTLAFGLRVPARAILSITAMLLMLGFVMMIAASRGIKLPVRPAAQGRGTGLLYAGATLVVLILVFAVPYVRQGFSVGMLMTAIYFGLVIPLYEELLFRGYIWARLESIGMSQRNIGLFTAAAFSLWHFGYWDVALFYSGNPGNTVPYLLTRVGISFVVGLLLAFVRYKSKNCYACMLVHGALNALRV